MRYIFIWVIITFVSSYSIAADLIRFDSKEGIERLESSKARVDFFQLANYFESQENKIFCGLASSAMVLNALRLDNAKISKPEDSSVLSAKDRTYLPKGFNPIFERYSQRNVLKGDVKSKSEILGKPLNIKGKKQSDYGLQLRQLADLLVAHGLDVKVRVASHSLEDSVILHELIENLKTRDDYVLVNYFRKTLGQEGAGHISPLAAYDAASDSFLVLDVNPNHSKWTWIASGDLIKAMRTFDTIENRGYVLIKEGN